MLRCFVPLHLVTLIAPLTLCGLLWVGPIQAADQAPVVRRTVPTRGHTAWTTADARRPVAPKTAFRNRVDPPATARARVTVEHSVTVVRHDVRRQVETDTGAPPDENPEVVGVVPSDLAPRQLVPIAWQSVRTSRQTRTARSWSIHDNPAWSYHPHALRYQPKLRTPHQPRRDWTYRR